MKTEYDAIVVGARCAGSPTAMLLARKGYRVLVVDRATFPSDTLSTHMIHGPGVAALRRWGLLDQVAATGCPPIDTYSFDFGPFTIAGHPRTADGIATAYSPRRTVLDKILVDAAAQAGAEVREAFTVDDIVVEDGIVVGIRGHAPGGGTVLERARVVIGADGRNSHVARVVEPEHYHDKPMLQLSYYTYWSGLPVDGFEIVIRPDRGWGAMPTNDGLTLLVVGWPYGESSAYKADVEASYLKTLELAPEVADRVRGATREARFAGGAVPNFFRKPFGPGWALVGDAGYTKDPITAQGISDAFRDAELCSIRPRRDLQRRARVQRGHGRLPPGAGRRRAADLRVHHAAGHPPGAAAGDAAAPGGRARQSGRHGRLRRHHRRDRVAGRVLRPRTRRPHHGHRRPESQSWRDDQSSAARITEVRPTTRPTIQPATSWPTSTAPRMTSIPMMPPVARTRMEARSTFVRRPARPGTMPCGRSGGSVGAGGNSDSGCGRAGRGSRARHPLSASKGCTATSRL